MQKTPDRKLTMQLQVRPETATNFHTETVCQGSFALSFVTWSACTVCV